MSNTAAETRIVVTNQDEIFILDSSDFDMTQKYLIYDQNGQIYDHETAGSSIEIKTEKGAELIKGILIDEEEDVPDFIAPGEYIIASEYDISYGAFCRIISEVDEQHAELVCEELKVYTYYDGHNLRSIILGNSDDEWVDVWELSKEESKQVLQEFDSAEFSDWNQGHSVAETENYEFDKSIWQGTFSIATVECK